jgi:hypothetical protein
VPPDEFVVLSSPPEAVVVAYCVLLAQYSRITISFSRFALAPAARFFAVFSV